ncbi:hypothetical protein [Nitrosospira sp. Nsp14]|uniref:hypothetical protein n=1 Tax=Nitrosospira sp. Nsp14 TaxID=1855333 RepID=UPI00116083E3|nr:hypothetical protein [Nitrosospira sp. Nsp14]
MNNTFFVRSPVHALATSTGKPCKWTAFILPEELDCLPVPQRYHQERAARAAVEMAEQARPALSPFLFCNRKGEGYLDEETGNCHGWDSMWGRFMDWVLKETRVSDWFTEHDLRAKRASAMDSWSMLGRCYCLQRRPHSRGDLPAQTRAG